MYPDSEFLEMSDVRP
uniref:Uncharacterized protein n=1 Tax=Anguilla anguilla TaxID=7936 RepID=A0A0E9VJ56_ANGAN